MRVPYLLYPRKVRLASAAPHLAAVFLRKNEGKAIFLLLIRFFLLLFAAGEQGAASFVARAFLPSSTKISIQIRCRADFCVIFYVLPGEHDKHPPSMDTKHPSIEEHLLLFALPELPLEMSLRLERLFIRALHMGMRDEVR